MRQPLLHRRQHILSRFREHHAGGIQAGAGEAGGEQIRPFPHPQHRAFHPAQYPREEYRRRRAMLGIRSGAHDLMQSAQKQAAGGDVTVEGGKIEGEDRPGRARASVLYPRDLVA